MQLLQVLVHFLYLVSYLMIHHEIQTEKILNNLIEIINLISLTIVKEIRLIISIKLFKIFSVWIS